MALCTLQLHLCSYEMQPSWTWVPNVQCPGYQNSRTIINDTKTVTVLLKKKSRGGDWIWPKEPRIQTLPGITDNKRNVLDSRKEAGRGLALVSGLQRVKWDPSPGFVVNQDRKTPRDISICGDLGRLRECRLSAEQTCKQTTPAFSPHLSTAAPEDTLSFSSSIIIWIHSPWERPPLSGISRIPLNSDVDFCCKNRFFESLRIGN